MMILDHNSNVCVHVCVRESVCEGEREREREREKRVNGRTMLNVIPESKKREHIYRCRNVSQS